MVYFRNTVGQFVIPKHDCAALNTCGFFFINWQITLAASCKTESIFVSFKNVYDIVVCAHALNLDESFIHL